MFEDVEDGEILSDNDVEFDGYEVLDRGAAFPPVRQMEQDNITDVIEDDDDDDDDESPKIPLLPKIRPVDPRSKFNVWQVDTAEDLAVSFNCTLGQSACGPMDRDVESYSIQVNGRNLGRKFVNLKTIKGDGTRRLAPITEKPQATEKEIAEEICKKLSETNKCLIYSAVEVLGKKKALKLYRQTRKIEKEGGLLVMNKSRKRSSGGVFLFLIHQDKTITESQLKAIFGEEGKSKSKLKKKKKKKKSNCDENDFASLLLKTRAKIEHEKAGRTPPPSPASPTPDHGIQNPSSPEMVTC